MNVENIRKNATLLYEKPYSDRILIAGGPDKLTTISKWNLLGRLINFCKDPEGEEVRKIAAVTLKELWESIQAGTISPDNIGERGDLKNHPWEIRVHSNGELCHTDSAHFCAEELGRESLDIFRPKGEIQFSSLRPGQIPWNETRKDRFERIFVVYGQALLHGKNYLNVFSSDFLNLD